MDHLLDEGTGSAMVAGRGLGHGFSRRRMVLGLLAVAVVVAGLCVVVAVATRRPAVFEVRYAIDFSLSIPDDDHDLIDGHAEDLRLRLEEVGVRDYKVTVENSYEVRVVVYTLPEGISASSLRSTLVTPGLSELPR